MKNSTDINTNLDALEAEAIYIIREVAAECENPVMLYSIGKDSSVMLHLAMKAFFPEKPPFPFMHIDTTWKFKEMIEFRDKIVDKYGIDMIVYKNEEGIKHGINPFEHGAAYTDIMKTQALKQAISKYGFTAAFGGGRRDEEKSRAKERIFSFRNREQAWNPKNQRPEMWNEYNTRINQGESIRVFPISNWTEKDIWQYIEREKIDIVPLYFAKERPIVYRDGNIIMVDDNRMPIREGEEIVFKKIRFRTLGCYPLTGGLMSFGGGDAYLTVADGMFVDSGMVTKEEFYSMLAPLTNVLPGSILCKTLSGVGYYIGIEISGSVLGGLSVALAGFAISIVASCSVISLMTGLYEAFGNLNVFSELKRWIRPIVSGLLVNVILSLIVQVKHHGAEFGAEREFIFLMMAIYLVNSLVVKKYRFRNEIIVGISIILSLALCNLLVLCR